MPSFANQKVTANQESTKDNFNVNQSSTDAELKLKHNHSLQSIFFYERNSSNGGNDDSSSHSFGLNNFGNISILPNPSFQLQPKLKINSPGDKYEQEADRVADQVMRISAQTIQRKCEKCIKEEEIQRTPLISLQRKCAKCEEEEEMLQTKSRGNSTNVASSGLMNQIQNTRGGGQAMDTNTRSFMEPRFGSDFGGVRIHADNQSTKMNQEINARAFTVGRDIYFNQGAYNPGAVEGKRLLAHELTHVVQQKGEQKLIQKAPNEIDIPDKGRTCKAKREYKILEKSLPTSTKFDINRKNITLNIKWCKGKNLGDITIGANVPQQAEKVAKDIIDTVRQGGGRDQIEEKLRDIDLTPFMDVIIKKGGAFSITAHGEITVDSTGIKGGKGSLDLDLGRATISPNIEAGRDTGLKVGVDLKVPLGKRKVEDVKCKTEKIRIGNNLNCECPTPAKKEPGMLRVLIPNETRFLYFDYNSANIDEIHSEKSILEIKRLLGLDYQAKKIVGFTSPEGTADPSPGFEGNKELAEKRAEAARIRIGNICSPFKIQLVKCDSNVLKNVKQLGVGELHSSDEKGDLLKDEKGIELRGKELAKHAIGSFEESKEEQQHLEVLPEKEKIGLLKARTPEEKSKFIYPLLRRVEITFGKLGTKNIPIEFITPPGKEPCPPEVLKQAEKKLPLKLL